MSTAEVFITPDRLIAFAEALLNATRVSQHKSRLAAASLVAANLRGVDSHGVQLLPYYLQQLEWGDMDANLDGCIISESGSCLHYDGQNGIGQAIAEICCGHAVRIASKTALSMVIARDSNHFGAAAFWAQKMAAAGQIGIVMC